MKKSIIIVICILIIIGLGIFFGINVFNKNNNKDLVPYDGIDNSILDNQVKASIEVSNSEEKTTPKTLIIYKTYYTKCKHYTTKYEDIDTSLVNLTQKEFKDKCKGWTLEKFSSKEIELSKQEEKFCNEHYKIKLENNVIVIYNVYENGRETEYEQTGITTEYLTEEDILKLTTGIIIFGKENLTSTIEDYE